MERDSVFSAKEIIGIAAAGAIALGGIIAAFTRSQQRGSRSLELGSSVEELGDRASESVESGRRMARGIAQRLSSPYPGVRREFAGVADRVIEEISSRRDAVVELLTERLPDAFASGIAIPAELPRERARSIINDVSMTMPEIVEQFVEIVSPERKHLNARTRDTLVSIIALSGASLIAYIVLLAPERRERVKDSLCRLIAFGQVLSDDFRGYDEGY